MKQPLPLTDRFWAKVVKHEAGCWLWAGAKTHGGYGVIQAGPRGGRLIRAHRLSWHLAYGAIPEGMDICHRCDTPACVRPDHLFPGDAKANGRDMRQKGRGRGGPPTGEMHPQAKLTSAAVAAIRSAYAAGGVSAQTLADEHGVSKKTILNVVHRRIWR